MKIKMILLLMLLMAFLGSLFGVSVTMAYNEGHNYNIHKDLLFETERGINICKNRYFQEVKIDNENQQFIILDGEAQ